MRLAYAPELLVPLQLRALEGHLPALLRLAHASETQWLLDGLEAYIAGKRFAGVAGYGCCSRVV